MSDSHCISIINLIIMISSKSHLNRSDESWDQTSRMQNTIEMYIQKDRQYPNFVYLDAYVSVGNSLRKIGGDACYNRVDYFCKSYLKHKKTKNAVYTELKAQNLTEHFDNVDEIITTHVQHRKWV